MMDYYSNFEGPSRNGAIKLLEEKLTRQNKPQWLKNLVGIYVDEEIFKYGGLGSQTGWHVSVEPSIWTKLLNKEQICNKHNKLWKNLFYKMRIYNVFMKIYTEVYYKPHGDYMKEIQDKHKSYFK
jgi:hypothetical protein